MHVAIETAEGLDFGRTVCDRWNVTGQPANALVGLEVDAEGFFDLLVERIGRYR
jgi:purine nucleosidase